MGAGPHADFWDEVAALLSRGSSLLKRAEGFGSSAAQGRSMKSAAEEGAHLLEVGDGVEQQEGQGSGWTQGHQLDGGDCTATASLFH